MKRLIIRIPQVIRQMLYVASVPLLVGGLLMAQQPGYPPPGAMPPPGAAQGQAQQAPRLFPQQLDTLVAPVALYPDGLLGQVMAASTYPLEITEASQWLQQNPGLQGSQLVEAARQQNWDPSVQALVVFPDVLTRLASDIRWTTDLGNAFLAQQADVMAAVQRMRSQAMNSGKLRSNQQQRVTTEMQGDQSAIDIQPANPQVVYVPYYNPTYIWGPPAYGYYPPWDYLDVGYGYGYGFGPGIYLGGFFGALGWGGWGWGFHWFGGGGLFLNVGFFNHYGFGGVGFRGGLWAHDPGHRLGVSYPNSALRSRYGAASAAGARASFAGSRYSSAPRAGVGQAGGWNRFGQNGTAAGRSYGANNAGNAYRGGQSYGGNAGNAYRGAQSNAGNAYHAAPSYSGGSNGGYRSAPNYRPSGGGQSTHSSGSSSHSSGGGGSHASSGGGSHGGGGGGHSGGGHR